MPISKDTVGVDWYQGTFPEDRFTSVYRTVLQALPAERPLFGKGRSIGNPKPFHRSYRWASGVQMHHGGHANSIITMPGSACTTLGFDRVCFIARDAMIGGKCTRLDLRRDLEGEAISFLDDMILACESSHLRRVRQYTTYPIKSITQQVLGSGVLLGSYSSPRFVRCYDKGLEQASHPPGCWIRFEAQLRDDHSNEAAIGVFSPVDLLSAKRALLQYLLGVVDFRIPSDRNIDRCERPAWWEAFIGDLDPIRTTLAKRPPSLERYAAHITQQLSPLIAAARKLGTSPGHLVEQLISGQPDSRNPDDNPTYHLLIAYLEAGGGGRVQAESSQA